jgi:hypothetical protein
MVKTKKFWKIFVCVFFGITFIGVIIFMALPFTSPRWMTGAISLSRPESAIRRDLLRITPVGTSKEDVIRVIDERGWTLRWTRATSGYYIVRGRASDGATPAQLEDGTAVEIGTQSIRIDLGSFFRDFIGVDVYFAFDEDSNLVDIAIRREMDVI